VNDDEFMPTRRSLLSRLKNWEDQGSWKEFFDTYGKLIYRFAVKAGLTNAKAQDVVEETVFIVAKKMRASNTIRRWARSKAGWC
jgi:DNA-directed RNA polymerase specialized sigma24 family protein